MIPKTCFTFYFSFLLKKVKSKLNFRIYFEIYYFTFLLFADVPYICAKNLKVLPKEAKFGYFWPILSYFMGPIWLRLTKNVNFALNTCLLIRKYALYPLKLVFWGFHHPLLVIQRTVGHVPPNNFGNCYKKPIKTAKITKIPTLCPPNIQVPPQKFFRCYAPEERNSINKELKYRVIWSIQKFTIRLFQKMELTQNLFDLTRSLEHAWWKITSMKYEFVQALLLCVIK